MTDTVAASDVPYAGLTPDRVLDALASVGMDGDGRLLALNSYENRVYQVWLDPDARPAPELPASARGAVVVKFYRPGRWSDAQILEEHAFVAELARREIPAIAPLRLAGDTLHAFAEFRFAVYPRQGGRVEELAAPAALAQVGRFLGRMHAVGAIAPFEHRPRLDLASFGQAPRAFLGAGHWIPADLRPAWTSVADQALGGVARAFASAGEVRGLRLHGDCYPGNLLWTETPAGRAPHFVDFDDARMGPAVQDLWMLLSGTPDERATQLGHLLAGYQTFHPFDRRELLLIEALRTLRLVHYSAWLASRWRDPAFPLAFPWFGTPRYWQDRVLELREQVAAMDEPPLMVE